MNCDQATSLRIFIAIMFWLCCGISTALSQHLEPSQVLIIYNKANPDSKKLAEFYQVARKIPDDQILGLTLPIQQDISRDEYETTILTPLRDHFTKQNWWKRSTNPNGIVRPTENRIRAIVLMRGVPLRIKADPSQAPKAGTPDTQVMAMSDQASVDSELALFGVETLPTISSIPNDFFKSEKPLAEAKLPHLILVNRIDASGFDVCKRMITDAVETEKRGLWGNAYIDIANKVPQGDQWLENIAAENHRSGIPTITDRFDETFPKNYPMTDAAIYYGWYERNVNGPFLNPSFQFRRGAIALHIHSYSAEQLTDPHKNWSSALLLRGATATVGNVYEPFLHLSHNYDILHNRLLRGWTLAEASSAAMMAHSWQGVVFGDPLYRPFLHLGGTGEKYKADRDFRILSAASREWPGNNPERLKKLELATNKLSSATIAEGLAIEYLTKKDLPNARIWLKKARDLYPTPPEKARQDLQLAAIERTQHQKSTAIAKLQTAHKSYGNIPEAEAFVAWLKILGVQ